MVKTASCGVCLQLNTLLLPYFDKGTVHWSLSCSWNRLIYSCAHHWKLHKITCIKSCQPIWLYTPAFQTWKWICLACISMVFNYFPINTYRLPALHLVFGNLRWQTEMPTLSDPHECIDLIAWTSLYTSNGFISNMYVYVLGLMVLHLSECHIFSLREDLRRGEI